MTNRCIFPQHNNRIVSVHRTASYYMTMIVCRTIIYPNVIGNTRGASKKVIMLWYVVIWKSVGTHTDTIILSK